MSLAPARLARRAAKRLASAAAPSMLLPGKSRRLILAYHDVSDPDAPHHSSLYSTSIDLFRAHLAFLKKYYTLVDLDVITSASPYVRGRLASITFDDGYASVLSDALPILQVEGVPFTVFLNQRAIEENRLENDISGNESQWKEKVFLDRTDVLQLVQSGVAIGNHTISHPVLSRCNIERLELEIRGNREYLEELTGRPVRHLAIPYGKKEHFDDRGLEISFQSGHTHVYTSNPTTFRISDLSDGRLVPRVGISGQSVKELSFLINRCLVQKIDL